MMPVVAAGDRRRVQGRGREWTENGGEGKNDGDMKVTQKDEGKI